MRRTPFSKDEILKITSQTIQSFYKRDITHHIHHIHPSFVWIGAFDFQFAKSKAEFLEISQSEQEAEPFHIYDEAYELLTRDRDTIVVYGSLKLWAQPDQGSMIRLHTRLTVIWKFLQDAWYITHIHGSNAQDIPMQPERTLGENPADTAFFKYLSQMHQANMPEKISFRDVDGKYQIFSPNEISHLQAAGGQTVLFAKGQPFQIAGNLALHEKKLTDGFHRVHKSYIVNGVYVKSLCRYTITLKDGTALPVGKSRYMALQETFKGTNNLTP